MSNVFQPENRVRLWFILVMMLVCLAGAAQTQTQEDARLQMNHLNRLAGKAVEAVDVTFDETMLRAMATTRSGEARNPETFRALLSRLQGVSVKGFRFDSPGAYAEADVAPLRAQLARPGWKRIVAISDKQGKQGWGNGELYLFFQGEALVGVTALSATPTALYIVNAAGPIELDEISLEEGLRGLSRLDPSWSVWVGARNRSKGRNGN
jgi:hypothetical protein